MAAHLSLLPKCATTIVSNLQTQTSVLMQAYNSAHSDTVTGATLKQEREMIATVPLRSLHWRHLSAHDTNCHHASHNITEGPLQCSRGGMRKRRGVATDPGKKKHHTLSINKSETKTNALVQM